MKKNEKKPKKEKDPEVVEAVVSESTEKQEYMLKYYKAVESRHPTLFAPEKKQTTLFKEFYSAKTKGAAKRILRDYLNKNNS